MLQQALLGWNAAASTLPCKTSPWMALTGKATYLGAWTTAGCPSLETSSAERTPCYPCQLGTQFSCHLCARLWTSRGWDLDGDALGSLQQGPPSIDVSGLASESTMSSTSKLGLCLLVAWTGSCNALSLDGAQVPGPGRLGADRGKAFKSCCYKGARWSKIWWFVMGW